MQLINDAGVRRSAELNKKQRNQSRKNTHICIELVQAENEISVINRVTFY